MNIYEIYYDEESDFLEISFGESANEGTTEEIEPGIFLTKDIQTDKITNIGIMDFRKGANILRRILTELNISFPLKIDISD